MNNFLDNLIAHRGVHDNKNIIENTLESFSLAVDKKYTIELDLRFSKNKQIVVFHDESLKRLYNVDKKICDLDYDVLKNYNIPLFLDVLKLIEGKVPILIEIKVFNDNDILLDELISMLKDYNGKYAIQSFDYKIVKILKNKYPSIKRGLLLDTTDNLYIKLRTKPDFLSCKLSILKDKKIISKKDKYLILGWTLKKKNNKEDYKDYCDNFICNDL